MEKEKQLAKTIINYSIKIKEGDMVLITCETFNPTPLVKDLIKLIHEKKANVVVRFFDTLIDNLIKNETTEKKLDYLKKQKELDTLIFDKYIQIYYKCNDYESKNQNKELSNKIANKLKKYQDIKINKKKWIIINYPSLLDAYKAKMPFDDYYNYAMDVMNYDYKKLEKDIKPLKLLMEKTNKIRITGMDTNLTFSIKNMPIISCVANYNIPDGEIYCGPIKNSVNGTIKFNTPSPYKGNVYNNVCLTFEKGKIIKATSDDKCDKLLKEIFNTDNGSRFVGEFAIGLNNLIKEPMGDILFDEKIYGSIHLTPGSCYKDSYNGNESSIHWDLVLIQRLDYGGGNIYFDDVLIRRNGKFVLEELKHLNKK